MFILENLILDAAGSVLAVLPTEAGLNRQAIMQAALANSRVRLVQAPFGFATNTTRAQAVTAEANFDGYPVAGNVIAAWGNPLSVPGGGGAIAAETTFSYVDGVGHVANQISGGWVEVGGNMVSAFNFASPVTLQSNGDGIVLQLLDSAT